MADRGDIISIQPMGDRSSVRRRAVMPEERCPSTGKRRFTSEDSAWRSAAEWAQSSSHVAHVFPCDECKGYHLTKLEQHMYKVVSTVLIRHTHDVQATNVEIA